MFTADINPLTPSEQATIIAKGVWREGCPVPLARLRRVRAVHWGFDNTQQGGMIDVIDHLAPKVVDILRTLYQCHFPIASLIPIEEFDGDDEKSMAANNSSGFNHRVIAGSDRLSLHAYGCAIDINPLQNPYVVVNDPATGLMKVYPPQGIHFLNRDEARPDKPPRAGLITPEIAQIFKNNGLTVWGGDWDDPLDWHHFQTTRETALAWAQKVPQL
jgi:hypothetical protein